MEDLDLMPERPSWRSRILKFVGYALLMLMALALLFWPIGLYFGI